MSNILRCQKCNIEIDPVNFKSPKQVKYCSQCKIKVRKQKQLSYYHNKKIKCVCGANNNKLKTRCWKCGTSLRRIIAYTKSRPAFRQLEVMI